MNHSTMDQITNTSEKLTDPSVLTTAQIIRSVGTVELLFDSKLDVLREKFAGMDRAILAANETLIARLSAGDSQLMSHIEAQKVSVETALKALNQLLDEKEKAVNRAEASRKEARDKSDSDLKDKLVEMNKFRDQINHERANFVGREVHEGELKQLHIQIDRNREDVRLCVGKEEIASLTKEWTTWRTNVDKIFSEQAGKGDGINATAKTIIGGIGLVSVILAIIMAIVALRPSPKTEDPRVEYMWTQRQSGLTNKDLTAKPAEPTR